MALAAAGPVYGFGQLSGRRDGHGANQLRVGLNGGLPDGWSRPPMNAPGLLAGIVTPGQSTYPSQDGTFVLVRGTGAHWGNALIAGKYIVAGGSVGGFYDLDDNDTGLILAPNQAPQYRVGSELQAFIDASPTSPEYIQFLKDQRAQEEQQNPKLGAYDAALRAWAQSQQPPVAVDPIFGLATNFDMSQAPYAVQKAYADFTNNPIPEPPPAPSGPAKYLVSGITFGADGTVYDINGHGNPQGLHLSAAEVQSLLNTGALPPGDTFGQSTPTPPHSTPTVPSMSPPTTNPTSQPTGPTTTAPQQQTGTGGGATDATYKSPSGTGSDVSQPMTPSTPLTLTNPATQNVAATGGGIMDSLSSIPWYVWAGVAGVFILSRRKS